MKKRIVINVLIGVIIVITTFTLLKTKSEWEEEMEIYGPLNMMEMDEFATSNAISATYEITGTKDIYVSNNIYIEEGNIKLIIYLEDNIIYENTLEVGEYSFDTDIMEDESGKLVIDVNASDDVKGTYLIKVNTRERRWNTIWRKVKEYAT